MFLLLLAFFVCSSLAATDPACTTNPANPALSPSALACEDKDPAICKLIFGAAASTAAGRAAACIKDDPTAKINPSFKKLAIEKCAKHCGYCCLTPEYNCENKPFAQTGVNCSTMAGKCTDPKWKTLAAQNCPSTCGFCLEAVPKTANSGSCVDKFYNCGGPDDIICTDPQYASLAKNKCAKTCGLCTPTGATPTTVSESCVDKATDCTPDYCHTTITAAYANENCKKTCGLCTPTGSDSSADSGSCVDIFYNCGGPDDIICTDPQYASLAKNKCAKTCGRC